MVSSFSASVFCRRVCLVYFDVNTGYVFNQVLKVVSGEVVSGQQSVISQRTLWPAKMLATVPNSTESR